MQVTIQGRQIDLGENLRTHVEDTLDTIDEKFFHRATFAGVTFSREGHGHGLIKTAITWQIGRQQLHAEACEGNAPLSFEIAAERLAQQLRKHKDRLRGHHHTPRLTTFDGAIQDALNLNSEANDTEGPAIVAEMDASIDTMSVCDAVRKLESYEQPALLFYNASHEGLNMVYRRPDGNVGWVDPAGNHVIASQAAQTGRSNGHARA